MRANLTTPILFLCLLSIFLFTACSDDSTSALDPGDPPQVPDSVPMEIDKTMFEEADLPFEEEYEGFLMANAFVDAAASMLVGFANSGNIYLEIIDNVDPEYNDGIWVWEFTHQQGNESLTITTTAERMNEDVEWKIYLSGSLADFGGEFDDYMFARGVIKEDGSSGEWSYYAPESSQDWIYKYEWEYQSDSDFQINSIYSYDENEFYVNYIKQNADNTLEYIGFDDDREIIIYWNSETKEGYVDDGDERRCWGEDYREVPC